MDNKKLKLKRTIFVNTDDIPMWVDFKFEYIGFSDDEIKEYENKYNPLERLGLKDRLYLSQYIIGKDNVIHWIDSVHSDAYNMGWVKWETVNGKQIAKIDISEIPGDITYNSYDIIYGKY